jgi:5-formyltetrahydrofolate cyclo-ligase
MVFKNKKQIRKEIIGLRNSLSVREITDKSSIIFKRLEALDAYQKSKTIMCYMDFRNEVATRKFIINSLENKKRILLPLVDKINKNKSRIIPYEVNDLDLDLEKGILGILEPKKSLKKLTDYKDIDVIVVPGVAFDPFKNRIGYGAGYYDRFLKTVGENCLKIGVAFELQIINRINADTHDVPLNIIITEKRVIL